MDKFLCDLEFYLEEKNGWVKGEIIGIYGEKSFIMTSPFIQRDEIVPIENIRKITKIDYDEEFENSTLELEIEKGCYSEVEIKEQKGNFFLLIFKKNPLLTKLSRKKNLRYTSYINLSEILQNEFSNIIIPVPKELSQWIQSERYNEILENINEDSEINSFYSDFFPSNEPSNIRILCLRNQSELIKMILGTSIENEIKLQNISSDKDNNLKQLEDLQKKNKTFYVSKKYVGMLIGSKGSNLVHLKKKYSVNITVDANNLNDKNEAKVTISGENGNNVEQCFIEMNLCDRYYEIRQGKEFELKKNSSRIINDYNLKLFYISNKDVQDDNGKNYKAPNLKIVGPKEYINDIYYKELKYYINIGYNNNGSYNNYNRYNNNNYKYNKNYYY